MKLKVCGMKDTANITKLLALQPDFIGFILYPKSKRFVGDAKIETFIREIKGVKKVGVFVNEDINIIKHYVQVYQLDYIQLHGDETPEFCAVLHADNYKIIKAFQVGKNFDFAVCERYETVCNYFLFDTKSEAYGGSGKQFDWSLLKNYQNTKPYFLSGGISINDIDKIKEIEDDRAEVLDINSKFEDENGLKKIEEIKNFMNQLKIKNHE